METVREVIQKFVDTYLLPAVATTIIAAVYYIWRAESPNRKPLAVFKEMFYIKNEAKNTTEKLTEKQPTHYLHQELIPSSIVINVPEDSSNVTLGKRDEPGFLKFQKSTILDKVLSSMNREEHEPYPWKEHIINKNDLTSTETLKTFYDKMGNEPIWDYYDVFFPSNVDFVSGINEVGSGLAGRGLYNATNIYPEFDFIEEEDNIPKLPKENVDSNTYGRDSFLQNKEDVPREFKTYLQIVFDD